MQRSDSFREARPRRKSLHRVDSMNQRGPKRRKQGYSYSEPTPVGTVCEQGPVYSRLESALSAPTRTHMVDKAACPSVTPDVA